MVIWELLSLLGLFVLRIGVPVALIGLLTWWLARLDRKWQAEPIVRPPLPAAMTGSSTSEPSSTDDASNRPIIQVPCWVFRACSPERRAKCAVYQAQDCSRPCWRIHLARDGRLPAGCRTCAIFATTVALPLGAGAD